jgi:hypothetical protein
MLDFIFILNRVSKRIKMKYGLTIPNFMDIRYWANRSLGNRETEACQFRLRHRSADEYRTQGLVQVEMRHWVAQWTGRNILVRAEPLPRSKTPHLPAATRNNVANGMHRPATWMFLKSVIGRVFPPPCAHYDVRQVMKPASHKSGRHACLCGS